MSTSNFSELRDWWQITFVMLNGFCLLSTPPPPVLNGEYQYGYYTKQNQMKNTSPFHIIFQVLKVLLIKTERKIEPPDLLFTVVLISFYISRYHFSQIFRTSFNIIWKTDFRHEFSFFHRFTNPPPHPTPLTAKIR